MSVRDRLIGDFGLSGRANNVVANLGARSLGELADLGWEKLERQPNCGRRTINELEALLQRQGLRLRGFARQAAKASPGKPDTRSLEAMSVEELAAEVELRWDSAARARRAVDELRGLLRVHTDLARAAEIWLAQRRAENEYREATDVTGTTGSDRGAASVSGGGTPDSGPAGEDA